MIDCGRVVRETTGFLAVALEGGGIDGLLPGARLCLPVDATLFTPSTEIDARGFEATDGMEVDEPLGDTTDARRADALLDGGGGFEPAEDDSGARVVVGLTAGGALLAEEASEVRAGGAAGLDGANEARRAAVGATVGALVDDLAIGLVGLAMLTDIDARGAFLTVEAGTGLVGGGRTVPLPGFETLLE